MQVLSIECSADNCPFRIRADSDEAWPAVDRHFAMKHPRLSVKYRWSIEQPVTITHQGEGQEARNDD